MHISHYRISTSSRIHSVALNRAHSSPPILASQRPDSVSGGFHPPSAMHWLGSNPSDSPYPADLQFSHSFGTPSVQRLLPVSPWRLLQPLIHPLAPLRSHPLCSPLDLPGNVISCSPCDSISALGRLGETGAIQHPTLKAKKRKHCVVLSVELHRAPQRKRSSTAHGVLRHPPLSYG